MARFTRYQFARLHRWVGVGLSPVIALILLSGLVLSARPGMMERRSDTPPSVDIARLHELVARIDSAGTARYLVLDPERTIVRMGRTGEPPFGAWDIATGNAVPEGPDRRDMFAAAESVHKELGVGLGWLESLGSLAIVLVVGIGPFLGRKARRGTTLGRHVRAGWLLLPFALYLPVTLVLMQVDFPARSSRGTEVVTMSRALDQLKGKNEGRDVVALQLLPGWTFLALDDGRHAPRKYRLVNGVVSPLKGPVATVARTLHEGAWGGIWGGVLNAFSSLVLLWMLATGLMSSWRRRTLRSNRRVGDEMMDAA